MAKNTKQSDGFNRRDFFKRLTGQHKKDFLHVPTTYKPRPPDPPVRRGPGVVVVKLRVNGVLHELDIQPQYTLLRVLREQLNLTGVKEGCNEGECGACTVLLNNQPVNSCHILALEAEDFDITTIENLAETGTLHKIQEAFIRHDALSCGFCVPAQVLCIKSLLDRDPYPTEDKVRDAIAGVACRCGIQQRVIAAAKDPDPVMTGLTSIRPPEEPAAEIEPQEAADTTDHAQEEQPPVIEE